MNIDFTDLTAVLTWLTTMGAPFVVMYAFSLLAENWPKWHELHRAVKFTVPLVMSVLVSIGATLLLQNPGIVQVIAPYWTMVIAAVLAYVGSQQAYMSAKRTGYGVKNKPQKLG